MERVGTIGDDSGAVESSLNTAKTTEEIVSKVMVSSILVADLGFTLPAIMWFGPAMS